MAKVDLARQETHQLPQVRAIIRSHKPFAMI